MATVSEVLGCHPDYAGRVIYRNLLGEDLAGAFWDPASPVAKPSMTEIDARRAAVDLILADNARQQKRQERLFGETGADFLVRVLNAICLDVEKLIADLKPASFNTNQRVAATRILAVRTQLAKILADQP